MNEEFIFRIGADVSGFTKSISDVERELKKVQSELKTKTGAAIVETNKYIADLQSSLVNLRTSGLSKLPKAIGDGTASLTALGQVARDAPFGFIAIQNNLPILFDQFTNLSKSAGGVGGAFKSLGAALAGPAGISFAIGALISLITVAIQKYGSFEGALNAFIGKTVTAAEIQNRYNAALEDSKKSSAGEIANLDSLVKILTSANSTREQQIGAFDELNELYPGLLSNIKKENLNSALSLQLIAERTKLIKNQILLEGRKEALIKLIGESSLEAEKALTKLTTKPDFFSFEELAINLRGIFEGTNPVIARTKVLTKDFANASAAGQAFADRLDQVNGELTGVDAQITNLINSQKKLDQQDKKSAQDAKTAQKTALRNKIKNAKKEQKEQEELNESILQGIKLGIKTRGQLEKDKSVILKANEIKRLSDEYKNLEKATLSQADIDLTQDAIAFNPLPTFQKTFETINREANLGYALELMNSTFFSPIEDLFGNFLETGKFAFAEFGKAILQSIKQLVAKVIATGIIAILAVLATGGFGAAAGGFAGGLAKVGSIVGGSLGFGGSNKVAAPSFGGISGGPLNMAGAVNLSLRGSDLVGSINRTNATISRVG
jgi:hypothetical protein